MPTYMVLDETGAEGHCCCAENFQSCWDPDVLVAKCFDSDFDPGHIDPFTGDDARLVYSFSGSPGSIATGSSGVTCADPPCPGLLLDCGWFGAVYCNGLRVENFVKPGELSRDDNCGIFPGRYGFALGFAPAGFVGFCKLWYWCDTDYHGYHGATPLVFSKRCPLVDGTLTECPDFPDTITLTPSAS